MDLEKINYAELNQKEKEKFLPSFFISQILDVVSLEKLKFSKAEIEKTKLCVFNHILAHFVQSIALLYK